MSSHDFRTPDRCERRYLDRDTALYLDVSSDGLVRLEMMSSDPAEPAPCMQLSHADTLDLIEQMSAIVGHKRRCDGPTGTDFTKGDC